MILGQSLWHAFFESAVDTDEKFMSAMDGLVREIGDRGQTKTKVVEGVPPKTAAPASAAAALEPTPEPTLAQTAVVPPLPRAPIGVALAPEQHGFSPMTQQVTSAGAGGNFSELSSFFERVDARSKAEAKAARAEIEQQRK